MVYYGTAVAKLFSPSGAPPTIFFLDRIQLRREKNEKFSFDQTIVIILSRAIRFRRTADLIIYILIIFNHFGTDRLRASVLCRGAVSGPI